MKTLRYTPLTATPLKQNKEYREQLPQNTELAKYIRCFWGSDKPYWKNKADGAVDIVIPDTCVDIIYDIDYTNNTIIGSFCGVNDASFQTDSSVGNGHLVSTFAIRFYAWSACVFSEDSLRGTANGFYDIQSRFCWLDKVLRQRLFETDSMEERMMLAENILLQKLFGARQNIIVGNAVNYIVLQNGALDTVKLAKECFVSSRQLERLFHEYIGITPKKLMNLVRYQLLWNEIVRNPKFNVLDAVYKYGYTDQPHLMREFKRYHTMNIHKARSYALEIAQK